MIARARIALLLAVCLALATTTPAAEPKAADKAFDQLKAHQHGHDLRPLIEIEALIDRSSNHPQQREQLAARLGALLADPSTTVTAKQFICRQLERVGGDEHVPTLAKMLDEPKTTGFARRALQKIPGEAAAAALRAALPRARGNALVGLIHTLGERRDAKAAEPLAALVAAKDAMAAAAAARALGKIGTPQAADLLAKAKPKASASLRKAIAAAQLLCAAHLEGGPAAKVAEAIYHEALASGKAKHVRLAGLTGLVKLRKDKALPLLLDALATKDPEAQRTAANLMGRLSGPAVAAALTERLPRLDPQGQALAIDILARTGGPAARKAMAELAKSPNEAVRTAAIRALASAGDASTIEALAHTAAYGKEADQAAARGTLARLQGADVDARLLAAAGAKGDWRVRVELLDAIVARRSPNAVPTLLKAATDGHHLVRMAGFSGLRAMAEPGHYAALVKLLVDAPTARDIQAAQKALLAAAKQIDSQDAKVGPLLAAAKGARPEVKVAVIQALSRCGGPKALGAVRGGLKDPSPIAQDAAVRALAGWDDPAVGTDLLKLIKGSTNETHRLLAIRGTLRLARASAAKSADGSLKMLQQVRDAAKDPGVKKMLLAAVAELNTPGALAMAATFVGDPDVDAEATLATLRIARVVRQTDPDAAKAALARVLKLSKDPDAVRQANVLLGKTRFEPLFDGKTLKGWIKPFDWGKPSIVDGAIHLSGNKKFFLVTERTYGDFILEVEAHLDEGANSGIQYRSHFEKNRLWGYQADVDSLPRGWRGIYDETPGFGWLDRGNAEKAEKLYKKGWNAYRVECIGVRTRFFLNGELICDHIDPRVLDGHIALQHHGEKGKVVRYRNIRLMDLGKRRWLPLVDEKTIGTWESNGVSTWTVENGVIAGRKSRSGHGLLYSPRQYKDFTVRFKVRAVRGNAGFYIRSEKMPGTQGARGLQLEIDPNKDQSGLYEPHGRNWVAKPDQAVVKKHYKKGGWNEMAVTAIGGRLVVHLNGRRTVDLPNDKGRREGYFGLGTHGGGVEVEFKDIQILSN